MIEMKIFAFPIGLLIAATAAHVTPEKAFASDPAPSNCAETYHKAFDAAADTGLADSPVMQDVWAAPLDAQVKDLLVKNHQVVELVRQASHENACDWGNLPNDAAAVARTFHRFRMLYYLMILQTRQELKDNRPKAAMEDCLSSAAMARHLGEIKLELSPLVQDAIEEGTIERIAAALPTLPADVRAIVSTGWTKLPPGASYADTIMGQFTYVQHHPAYHHAPKAWIDSLEPFYKSLAAAADDPPAQFDQVADAQMAKFWLNSIAQTAGRSLERTRKILAIMEAKRAMLETAFAIVNNGKDQIAKSKDPFGHGPFKYQKMPGGFQLESALTHNDHPVTLRVGPS